MTASRIIHNAVKVVKRNSPVILTALGVGGVVTTSYLVAKASFEAGVIITANENEEPPSEDFKERLTERTKQVWRLYIPAGISGAATIACIIGSSKISGARVSAAATAYSLTDLAFSEYRDKVVEQIGKGKEQLIRDELAQDKVNKNPVGGREVMLIGAGHVLCCELYTQRYFRSDMEALRRAQNDINMRINSDRYVMLDEFYDILGLSHTSHSHEMGWDSDRLLDLHFSTVLSDANEPCLAFEYNYVKPLK